MLRMEKVQRPGHPYWLRPVTPADLLIGTRKIEEDGSMYFALVELIEDLIKDRMEKDDGHPVWYDFRFHLEVREDQEEPTELGGSLWIEEPLVPEPVSDRDFIECEYPWKASRQKSWRENGKVISEWLVEEGSWR